MSAGVREQKNHARTRSERGLVWAVQPRLFFLNLVQRVSNAGLYA